MPARLLISLLILLLQACGDPAQSPPQSAAESPATAPELPDPPAAIVAPDATWESVAQGYVYSDAPAVNAQGEIYYSANTQNRIFRLDLAGNISLFDDATALTMGLMFGPDGRLYGCRNRDAQIIAYDMQGGRDVLLQGELTPLVDNPDAPGEFCNDLVINSQGQIWFTDRVNRRVIYLATDGTSKIVAEGFRPNGIALSADETILAVTDSLAPRLWAFTVQADGSLIELPEFFAPVRMVERLPNDESARGRPGTNGMTVDSDGRFYVTSFYGIQVFDNQGAYVGVIHMPPGFRSDIAFGGPDFNWLYATGINAVYRIPTLVRGAPYFLRAGSG